MFNIVGRYVDLRLCWEFSVDVGDFNYLVIFGKHINGWFIAIPNHQICVEAAEPEDVFYNSERLERVLSAPEAANDIARAIEQYYAEVSE